MGSLSHRQGMMKEIDVVSIRRMAAIDIEYMPSIIMRFARMRIGVCYMRNPLDLDEYIVYNKEYA